jgi:hypothetical protein
MASKTFTVPAVQYNIVSIYEGWGDHSPGVDRSWQVIYDKKLDNGIGDSGLSGLVSSSLWNDIAAHAKDNVAEQFGVLRNSLHAEVWSGRNSVIVYMKKNLYLING